MREYIKLCDVCDFQGGSQPPKDEWSFDFKAGYIRMLQIRDFTQSERVAPEYIKITKTTRTCEADDILIARYGASLGKILTGLAGAYNVAIMRTIPDTNILEKKYLYYYLKSPVFQGFLLNVGSRAAQAGFNKNDLQDLFIPNITRNEQVEIVGILERVETVIESRQKELQKLDDLIKARFIEMFGRPFINNLNWESKQIKNVVNEVKYGTSKPSVENGEYKYLRMNNLTYDGRFDLTDLKFISLNNDELEKCVVRKGDVLFNRTNSLDLIGKTAEFDFNEDMVIAGYIIRIRLKETIVPKFFSMYMNTDEMKLHLRTIAKGAVNQANINAQELQEIPIYLPPIELQNQFADFVRQVDKSREEVKKSLEKTQQLYDSLMQEYFG